MTEDDRRERHLTLGVDSGIEERSMCSADLEIGDLEMVRGRDFEVFVGEI